MFTVSSQPAFTSQTGSSQSIYNLSSASDSAHSVPMADSQMLRQILFLSTVKINGSLCCHGDSGTYLKLP